MIRFSQLLRLFSGFLLLGLVAQTLLAFRPFSADPKSLLALGGYDSVAYVETGQAVKGAPIFFYFWNGVYWRFATQANLRKFQSTPERYAPALGGYCALSLADEAINPCDPTVFAVHEGKLYVFGNEEVKATWMKDPEHYIKEGQQVYERLLEAEES